VARWGYSTTLMVYELWNEVDLTQNYTYWIPEVAAWHNTMKQYLNSLDPNHMVTTSFSSIYSKNEETYQYLDFCQIHDYSGYDLSYMAEIDISTHLPL